MQFEVVIDIDGEFVPVAGLFGPVVDTRENSSFPSVPGKQSRGTLSFAYMTDGGCPVFRFLKGHSKPRDLNWQVSYSFCGCCRHTVASAGLQLITNAKTGLHTLTLKLPDSGLL